MLKGAYAELPRYFADVGKVMDLEARLIHCMTALQGWDTTLAQAQRDTGHLLKALRAHMGKAVEAGTDIGAAVNGFDVTHFKHLKHVDVWLPQLACSTYLEREQEWALF